MKMRRWTVVQPLNKKQQPGRMAAEEQGGQGGGRNVRQP